MLHIGGADLNGGYRPIFGDARFEYVTVDLELRVRGAGPPRPADGGDRHAAHGTAAIARLDPGNRAPWGRYKPLVRRFQ